MSLTFWKKFLIALLPKNEFWQGIFSRTFTKFLTALAQTPKDAADWIGSVYADTLPATTTQLEKWSSQLNFGYTITADKLAAELKQGGGQSPEYLQQALHDAGFTDLYVHEWWYTDGEFIDVECGDDIECGDDLECGGGIEVGDRLTCRNPYPYISTAQNNMLVNPVYRVVADYTLECGDDVECGDDAECAALRGYDYVEKIYSAPFDVDNAVYYFYIGAETWPNTATIAASKRDELLKIIYKIKPMQQRVILLISFDSDEEVIKDYAGALEIYKDDETATGKIKDKTW